MHEFVHVQNTFGLLTINRDETDRETRGGAIARLQTHRGRTRGDGPRGRRAESKGEEMEDET